MNKLIPENITRFVFLLLLQVLILNNLNILGYINPMIYVLWVILFPLRENKNTLLITSFILGLLVDFFSNSGGIHTFALVFVAYIRLGTLKIILNKSDFDYYLFKLRNVPFLKVITFISFLTIVHHFLVFLLSYFSFSFIYTIINKTFLTALFTIIIIILGLTIFTKKR